MTVSGFTFIRNAIKFDYPIIEAITSILPICDKFVVAVGNSDDETLDLIRSIDPTKIKIIETVWDDSLRKGGVVLAKETDKAYHAIDKDCDWAFYIQGDEIVHEKYHNEILSKMKLHKDNTDVDGLLFKYKHFYGSYDYVAISNKWYKHEIRVIKNNPNIYSYRDAQGFRKMDNKKLNIKPIDAYIYHYGWVKKPEKMYQKQLNFTKLYKDDQWIDKNIDKAAIYDFESNIDVLSRFLETHPKVMQKRISAKNWSFDHDVSFNKEKFKDKFKRFMRRYLGLDFTYRNYKIAK